MKQSAELERFDRERQTIIRLQKSEFEERLKDLNLAMADFSREYNESRGEVWPKQKAEALAKAIKRLESTHTWKTLKPPLRTIRTKSSLRP